jgi:hypothetical protein
VYHAWQQRLTAFSKGTFPMSVPFGGTIAIRAPVNEHLEETATAASRA